MLAGWPWAACFSNPWAAYALGGASGWSWRLTRWSRGSKLLLDDNTNLFFARVCTFRCKVSFWSYVIHYSHILYKTYVRKIIMRVYVHGSIIIWSPDDANHTLPNI